MLKILNWLGKKSDMKNGKHKYRVYDIKKSLLLKKDKRDKRDYKIKEMVSITKLPSKIDLSLFCNKIRYQSWLGACGGFALGSSYEISKNIIDSKKGEESNLDVSELFIYYNARKIAGDVDHDSGIYLRDGCKALQKNGVSLESLWPYIPEKYKDSPSLLAYLAGKFTRIEGYYRCKKIREIKTVLVSRFPVIFGMDVYSNYFQYKKGVYNKTSGKIEGGHAQTIVGYDDSKNAFLIRNSWGLKWGEKGYCWIDYDTLLKCLMDAWVIVPYGWKR